MKNRNIILVILGLFLLSFFSLDAKSYKRGISQNGFSYKEELDAIFPGVSWYYNWGNTPRTSVSDLTGNGNIEQLATFGEASEDANE